MPQLIIYVILAIIGLVLDLGSGSLRRRYSTGDYNNSNNFDVISWAMSFSKRRNRRISALKIAKNYLKPYEEIFGNINLSNKYCSVSLNAREKTITCMAKVYNNMGRKMTLTARNFSPIDIDEYFDMLCGIFNYNTQYKDVYASLSALSTIKEVCYKIEPAKEYNPELVKKLQKIKENAEFYNAQNVQAFFEIENRKDTIDLPETLTDVNNCSEAELTALPGISIIAAKKIINYREQERPFKSIDDFFDVMKIKPHFEKQLRQMICANKVNMKKVKKAKAERIIDL